MSNQEFLFTLIGIIMGIGIAQLLKGQTLLLKDYFFQHKIAEIRERWLWRLLWSVNLLLLVVQYIWGFRLEVDKIIEFWSFIYFLTIPALIYGTINYIFPDNVENVYKAEEDGRDEKEKKSEFLRRINLFYMMFFAWILSTLYMNITIYDSKEKTLKNAQILLLSLDSIKKDTLTELNLNGYTLGMLSQIGLTKDAIFHLKLVESDLDKIESKNIKIAELSINRCKLERRIEKLSKNGFETTLGLILKGICVLLLSISWYQKSTKRELAALTKLDFGIVSFSILMLLYYFYIRIE